MWPFVRPVCEGLTRGQKKFWLGIKGQTVRKVFLTALVADRSTLPDTLRPRGVFRIERRSLAGARIRRKFMASQRATHAQVTVISEESRGTPRKRRMAEPDSTPRTERLWHARKEISSPKRGSHSKESKAEKHGRADESGARWCRDGDLAVARNDDRESKRALVVGSGRFAGANDAENGALVARSGRLRTRVGVVLSRGGAKAWSRFTKR